MPFIIITGRNEIDRPTLVGEQRSQEPMCNIYLLMESSSAHTFTAVLFRWPVVNSVLSVC